MDIQLHYMIAGQGFPLVMLHGNGEDHTYFKHQMAPFSERYQVIALDTRGHGQSPRGTAPFTLEQFAEDLKGFLDSREISRCHLLGFSDERNHVESVFYNDKVNFERHFKAMPAELRPVVAKCFDSFYLLLGRDMQLARPERLRVYQELLHTLQSLRADVRKAIEASGGAISDPVALSDLMAMQNQLKNEVSALLDKLMQADMEIAFQIKQDGGNATPARSVG